MARAKKFRVLTKTLQIHAIATEFGSRYLDSDDPDGTITILLEDASQHYRAVLSRGLIEQLLQEGGVLEVPIDGESRET